MYNASNRQDIRRAEKEARIAEVNRLDYLKAAMSVPQGRAWFHNFLEACHMFSDPFTGDPLREAYSKGERNVGLLIYSDIVAHCPDDFIRMMKEAHERHIERNIRNATAEQPGGEDAGWDTEGSSDTPDLYTSGAN